MTEGQPPKKPTYQALWVQVDCSLLDIWKDVSMLITREDLSAHEE